MHGILRGVFMFLFSLVLSIIAYRHCCFCLCNSVELWVGCVHGSNLMVNNPGRALYRELLRKIRTQLPRYVVQAYMHHVYGAAGSNH